MERRAILRALAQPGLKLSLFCALGFALSLLAHPSSGQKPQREASELESALADLTAGKVSGRGVVVIADAGVVQAIPALEQQFKRETDPDTKVSIASGLVQLRNRDDTYWNLILERATFAVDSDVPDAVYSPSRGGTAAKALAPELQVWADAKGISLNDAAQESLFKLPGRILQLGTAGDSRGVPLLRRALQCRDYMMVMFAAKGLANVQDKESVRLIVAAAKNAPTGYRSGIAESLLYFDDPEAQSAFASYVEEPFAKATREAKAQGRRVFGW